MNQTYKKTGLLSILLLSGALLMAQAGSIKSVIAELQIVQKQLVPDKRVAILEMVINDTIAPLLIEGETNLPEAKAAITDFLSSKNIAFTNSMRVLPDTIVGEKTWGLVTLSVANLRTQPDHASELASQVLMGTPLKVLDYNGKWYRVQTPENYIGWMDTSAIRSFNQHEIDEWKSANRYIYQNPSGFAYDKPSKKGAVVTDLVMDDLFVVDAITHGYLKIHLPDGRIAFVNKKECLSFNQWINLEPSASAVLSMAKTMMGSPYLWGGTSTKGCDCSGFVKQAYYSQGVILARDASQQACYGDTISISKTENLQAADLLFFGSSAKHIGHVGMYVSNGNFIHCSGKVHISSLIANDPNNNRKRNLVKVCRVLHAQNNTGIVRVKDHPWYMLVN